MVTYQPHTHTTPILTYHPYSNIPPSYSGWSQVGVVVIIRTSHLYDLGLNPGLRMWAEICRSQSDFEGFLRVLRFSFRCSKVVDGP